MGGIETNIKGATRVKGIYAAGEAACVSLHGANRLGANSTAECLVWGRISGAEAGGYCNEIDRAEPVPEVRVSAEHKRIFEDLLSKNGPENLYRIRKELRTCIHTCWGLPHGPELSQLEKIQSLEAIRRHTHRQSSIYNAICITLLSRQPAGPAQVMVLGAVARTDHAAGIRVATI
jgi:succinate dehydrogenase / fumarate reductase flavoprotein subunit